MKIIEPIRYLTPQEAAKILRVSLSSIYRGLSCGNIPSIKIGSAGRRIPVSALGISPHHLQELGPTAPSNKNKSENKENE